MLEGIKKEKVSNLKATRQLGIMMFLTIFTQAIMLIKTSVIASRFGASVEMDAYNFANNIGTFIYSFIGAGVTTILIPNMVTDDKKEEINIFLSFLYSIAFIVLIIVQVFKVGLVKFLSNGSNKFLELTCNVMFITLITQYINSFTGTTNAIFQCKNKFNFPKFINLLTSIILVGLIILTPDMTINKYASIIFITTIINVVIQVVLAYKCGFVFKYSINFRNKGFIRLLKVFIPTVLSTGLYQISLLIDNIISSNLGEGELSKLTYSNNIISMINTVILANIITFFYPKIAKSIKDSGGQKKLFDLSIVLTSIMILMVSGFITVGKDGVRILYERGEFTTSITDVVFICTVTYIISLPTNALRDLIYRYFYANEDTVTPLRNSILISIINIVISILLAKFIGIYGVVLGTTISSVISLGMIIIRMYKKFGIRYDYRILVKENSKFLFCGIIATLLVDTFKRVINFQFSCLINIIVYGFLTITVYIGTLYLLKSKVFKIKLSD